MPPFSTVIVTWNSEPELWRLLTSIGDHLGDSCEVIVVDNASTDGTLDVTERWDRDVITVALERNRGFGAANNIGIERARHDVVVLLNPDTRLPDGSLSSLAELARSTGAICGPELLNDDLSRQPSASAPPGGWEVWVDAFVPAKVMPRALRDRCEPWRAKGVVPVGWLTGACLAARRQLLIELGPFDERIHLYSEDLDLGLRAWRHGYASLYAPTVARVVHLGDRSASRRFEDAGLELSVRNRRWVVRSRLGRVRDLSDFSAQVAFHATRYMGKRLLRRDADRERSWLACAARLYA